MLLSAVYVKVHFLLRVVVVLLFRIIKVKEAPRSTVFFWRQYIELFRKVDLKESLKLAVHEGTLTTTL